MQLQPRGIDEPIDEGLYRNTNPGIHADRSLAAFLELITEMFALQTVLCCQSQGNNHDDISAVMRHFVVHHLTEEPYAKFVQTFMSEFYRFVGLHVDYSGDMKPEIYLKAGFHQTTLSLQLSLGFNGVWKHSTLSGKIAYSILQLRWASLSFAMGLKSSTANPSPEEQLARTGEQGRETIEILLY